MPKEPTLTVDDLIRDGGFSEDENDRIPLFYCIVAENEETQ